MLNLLFVYGTLRSGFDNPYARLLRANASFEGAATVRGSARVINGYLAFSPEPAGEVPGELYRLNDPETTLAALDRYEGDGYERVIVHAGGLESGELETWIYRRRGSA